MFQTTADDADATAATFRLNAEAFVVSKLQRAIFNDAVVATHHVNALPTIAPSFYDASIYAKMNDARQLDAIAIAFRTDVAHS